MPRSRRSRSTPAGESAIVGGAEAESGRDAMSRRWLPTAASDLGPADELAVGTVAALRGERADDVDQRPGMGLQLVEADRPVLLRGRRPGAPVGRLQERLVQVPAADRLGPSLVADVGRGLPCQSDGIVDAGEGHLDRQRPVEHLAAGIRKGQQVAGQVAAVNGGDVGRRERLQRARVVPVVEMPVKSLEPPDGGERGLDPLDHLQGADPAEVPGGHGRQQVNPDVGR